MKIITASRSAASLVVTAALFFVLSVHVTGQTIELRKLGTYATGVYNQGASEIVAHDPATQRLYTVNGASPKIDVLSIANPSVPTLLFSIDMAPYGRQANSVAVKKGIVAAAVEAVVKTDEGKAVFFDTNGVFLNAVTVGALPDMITFTPDGSKVLVANEGEPNAAYTIDPEGSVSIIDVSNGVLAATVRTATLDYRSSVRALDPSVRIFGPNASIGQDLEPEYIAVSADSRTAWVTLQENNAVGVLNLRAGIFTKIIGLGFKNHNLDGNELDASDRISSSVPGVIEIKKQPVFGMYQPDGIAAFRNQNTNYFITANEGDARDYTGFSEEARVSTMLLDPGVFPNATFLKTDAEIGRLTVTTTLGNTDADAEYEALYVFGARSFSIWTGNGVQVYDSGSSIEQRIATVNPTFFNADSTNNTRDNRSDNKGPEPEGVTVGNAYGRDYAFVGLERIGGIMVYNLANPAAPQFVQYINNRNFMAATNTAAAGDLGPEGLLFIPLADSPVSTPLLVVANEISGTTTVYEIVQIN